MPRTNDPLASITAEIKGLLKDRRRNAIELGRRLLAVKQHVDHGEWLPWLENNFPLSDRTAANYMAAATWVDKHKVKLATVANLEASLLYSLAANDPDSAGEWSADDVAAVLEEAKARPVSLRRAHEILRATWSKAKAAEDDAAKAEEDAEIAAILDGPPPVLPPPPPTPGVEDQRLQCETEDIDAADFADALAMLARVSTRVIAEKMASAIELRTLIAATEFLNAVVAAATRKAA